MRVKLADTSTAEVSKRLVGVRNDVGAMAMGRVLTLVVPVPEADAEAAIADAMVATRQHPSRIVVLIEGHARGQGRLDAEIRVGGDAGASEILLLSLTGQLARHAESVVRPFLLADSPIVAWWPSEAPADVASSPIGRMAQRRVTDSATADRPIAELARRAKTYAPGDTDLAWSRVTRWRGLLAAALDEPPYEPVSGACVVGAEDSPSADLLAAWLAYCLKVDVRIVRGDEGVGLLGVRLQRGEGATDLVRPSGDVATLLQPRAMTRRVALAHRTRPDCLADELHRLDPDEIYETVLLTGLPLVTRSRMSLSDAMAQGVTPDLAAASSRSAGTKRTRQEGRR